MRAEALRACSLTTWRSHAPPGRGRAAAYAPVPHPTRLALARCSASAVGIARRRRRRRALYVTVARLGPPDLEGGAPVSTTVLDRHDQLLRAFTTPTRAAGGCPLAARRGRPALPRHAHGVRGQALLCAPRRRCALARARGLAARRARPHRLGRLDAHHAGRAPRRRALRALRPRQAAPDPRRAAARAAPVEAARSSRSICGSRRSAATSRACARPRSPTSARSRAACPSARRRCWWRCRSRPSSAGPTATRRPRAPRATACSSASCDAGVISDAEAERARLEPVPHGRRAFPKLAPHLAEAEVMAQPAKTVHRLTIDRGVQRALENLAEEQTKLLGQKLSAAILVVDHTHAARSSPTSARPAISTMQRFGAIDMATAVRSPGSTLKPFIYGLAFEAGIAHPETLIEDRAGALRLVRAQELRRGLPRHGDDPRGPGAVAQHPRGEGAGRRRPRQARRPLPARRRRGRRSPTRPRRRSPWRSAASA